MPRSRQGADPRALGSIGRGHGHVAPAASLAVSLAAVAVHALAMHIGGFVAGLVLVTTIGGPGGWSGTAGGW